MALKVGTKAPAARVAVRSREWIDLLDWVGEQPVVLLFFPLAFSSVCSAEMCAVAQDWAGWQDAHARVVGISVDSPYVSLRFAEETGAPFPIVSDFNREAVRAYDVVNPDHGGLVDVARRSAFVIDRSGSIVFAWEGEHPGVMPPFDEIREAVRQAV